jgi:eukaryotic-like serine/threonine-protein kinase
VLTPAADIFAWGAVVAYAGTGRTPFSADSPPATAARILTQPPDLSGLHGPLKDLIGHALEKDPANRPTARELLDLLVAGPQRPAATAAALSDQPGLRDAAREAQASTGYETNRQLTAVAVPPDLAAYAGETAVVDQPETFRGPPVRGPLPRRRKLLPSLLALLLLGLIGGGALLLLRGEMPWAWGSGPDGAAVSTGPTTSPPEPGRVLQITDPLQSVLLWQAVTDPKEKASCLFENDALVVRRQTVGSYRCRGPADAEPDDLQAEVNVRLLTRGACATIWFRFKPWQGYQVRVCEANILVGTHKNTGVEVLKTFPLDTAPMVIGGPATRITVTTRDDTVEVRRDGVPVGPPVPLTDPEIGSGRVLLGIFTEPKDPEHPPPYAVAFDHIDIYELPQ